MADRENDQSDPGQPLEFVSMRVPLDVLIKKLQEPKDVRVIAFAGGQVVAVCKSCNVQIPPADKDGLLWYVCPQCKGVSFTPLANLPRDFALAQQNGGVFEYEVFYLQDLPPQLQPPPPPGE